MRSRTRENLNPTVIPTAYVNYATGERILASSAYRVDIITRSDYMEDESHGDRFHTNYCLHRSAELSGSAPVKINKILGYQDDARKMPIVQEAYYYGSAGYGSSQPTVTTNLSQVAAQEDMIKGFLTGEVLTPVIFKELPQLKSTYKELTKVEFGVKKFANKFLAYEFGVLPFLSDLSSLRDSWSKIRSHVDEVNTGNKGGGLVKKQVKAGVITGSHNSMYPTGKNTNSYKPIYWNGTCKSHVRGRYFRQYTTDDTIRTALDYYGGRILNNVWEAIPYSFVVDWFFSVGDMISYLHPRFQVPCFQVLDACSTVKANLSVPLEVWDDVSNQAVHICTNNISYFKRVAGAALTPTNLSGPGLSPMRTALGLALTLQRAL